MTSSDLLDPPAPELHDRDITADARPEETPTTVVAPLETVGDGNADRRTAVAALLTVPFWHHFPGGKPLVLVMAKKSHAGKGKTIDFTTTTAAADAAPQPMRTVRKRRSDIERAEKLCRKAGI